MTGSSYEDGASSSAPVYTGELEYDREWEEPPQSSPEDTEEWEEPPPSFEPGYTGEWEDDVFVCFRGKDTRRLFTSHLAGRLRENGIKVFIDDNLEKTENIAKLLSILAKSAISVVIFSENFADSSYCLREVAIIQERLIYFGHRVLPIFYRVTPEDAIVDNVLKKLADMSASGQSDALVGMEPRIWKLQQLLTMDAGTSNDAHVIGIWGMGGNISSLIDLDVGHRRELLSRLKVVLLLDNVETLQQLEKLLLGGIPDPTNLFGPKSVIIITSRNHGVLKHAKYWKSFLNGLKMEIEPEIHDVLFTSYCALKSEEQSLFMDIACFPFYGDKSGLIRVFASSYNSVYSLVDELIDKSLLISVRSDESDNCYELVAVHDLLVEMAWNIVKAQPVPSRLKNADDVSKLFAIEESKESGWFKAKTTYKHTKNAFEG
ncbi:Disease resistance-like protein DSC1, partial [Linum perenne]